VRRYPASSLPRNSPWIEGVRNDRPRTKLMRQPVSCRPIGRPALRTASLTKRIGIDSRIDRRASRNPDSLPDAYRQVIKNYLRRFRQVGSPDRLELACTACPRAPEKYMVDSARNANHTEHCSPPRQKCNRSRLPYRSRIKARSCGKSMALR